MPILLVGRPAAVYLVASATCENVASLLASGATQTIIGRVNPPANAYAPTLNGWTMLTGIDFPDPGCWEFTAEYHDQVLTFVVRTVSSTEYQQFIAEHSQR